MPKYNWANTNNGPEPVTSAPKQIAKGPGVPAIPQSQPPFLKQIAGPTAPKALPGPTGPTALPPSTGQINMGADPQAYAKATPQGAPSAAPVPPAAGPQPRVWPQGNPGVKVGVPPADSLLNAAKGGKPPMKMPTIGGLGAGIGDVLNGVGIGHQLTRIMGPQFSTDPKYANTLVMPEQAESQPAPVVPQGIPSLATTGAINNAFAGNVQPPPLKTAQAAVTMQPAQNVAAPAEVAPPALAGYAKMGNQEYKLGADGTAQKFVNGQLVGDPAKASFTQAEVENGRIADEARNAKTLVANEASVRDNHVRAQMLHAQEYRDPATRNAMMATALKGSEQEAELLKQRGIDEAATQAAASKGAADVQSAQLKEQGATKRTQAGNEAAMARTKANNDAAMARLQAKPVPPQRPLTLLGPEGESAYAIGKDGATLIPMTVGGTAPAARQLPSGVDSKAAFAEAKAFIAQNPWAKEQVRARLQEYGLDPAGLDNG